MKRFAKFLPAARVLMLALAAGQPLVCVSSLAKLGAFMPVARAISRQLPAIGS